MASPRAIELGERLEHVLARFDVREEDRIRADARHRLHVLQAPRRVEVVHADHDLAPSVAPGQHRLDHIPARLLFQLHEDRVAQVQDDRVNLERARLVQIARAAPRHIEHRASGAERGIHPSL